MANIRRLEAILDKYAVRKVRELSVDDVMKRLKRQGITNLEDLVAKSLQDFASGGQVAKETFIYTQFVYHKERPVPDELLDIVESNIERF